MTYEAIIFDFDGVLFDSEKLHLQACNTVFDTLGFQISENDYFLKYAGLSDNVIFDMVFRDKKIACSQNYVEQLRSKKVEAYKSIIHRDKSLEGVAGIRKFLERRSKLINNFAICSGATRSEIDSTLDILEGGSLKKYFKIITTKDDIKEGKPSPEGYLLTAKRLKLAPENCLVVEDTPVGISAGKKAGMTVIGLTTTYNSSFLNIADFIAGHYDDIDDWITSQCGK